MAKVMVNDSTLTSIGEAIRSKRGTTTKYKPNEMPAAIIAIQSSGTGGNLDFSKLEYAEITRTTNGTLPDLSQFTTDFSKVVLLCWNSGRSTSSSTYLYLRGTDSDRSAHTDLFYFGSSYESTPTDSRTNYFVMDAADMTEIQVYQNGNTAPLTTCFRGTLIMFYEEG